MPIVRKEVPVTCEGKEASAVCCLVLVDGGESTVDGRRCSEATVSRRFLWEDIRASNPLAISVRWVNWLLFWRWRWLDVGFHNVDASSWPIKNRKIVAYLISSPLPSFCLSSLTKMLISIATSIQHHRLCYIAWNHLPATVTTSVANRRSWSSCGHPYQRFSSKCGYGSCLDVNFVLLDHENVSIYFYFFFYSMNVFN